MKEDKNIYAGIFSVRADQWDQFYGMMVDSADNFSTWKRWRIQVDQTIKEVAANGIEVVEIGVDLDEFAAWCGELGLECNGAARSRYASEILQKRGV